MKIIEKIQALDWKISMIQAKEKLTKSQQKKLDALILEKSEIIDICAELFKQNFKKRKTKLEAEYQEKTETIRKQFRAQSELEVQTTKTELEKQHETYYRSVFTALNEIQQNFSTHNLTKAIEITKRILTQHDFPELIQRAKDAGYRFDHKKQIFHVPSGDKNVPVVSELVLYNIPVQFTM